MVGARVLGARPARALSVLASRAPMAQHSTAAASRARLYNFAHPPLGAAIAATQRQAGSSPLLLTLKATARLAMRRFQHLLSWRSSGQLGQRKRGRRLLAGSGSLSSDC